MTQMIVDESDFEFSKFVCDEEMKERKGYLVYREWIKNSRKEDNRYFEIFSHDNKIGAYVLFNMLNGEGTVEIVKVNRENQGKHIATQMINNIESFLYENGIQKIKVGTQFNNIPAMNLYHFLGFKETSRTSIFHLWK